MVMFCTKTIQAQAPYFWRDLVSAVQASVPPSATFQKLRPNKFIVRKPIYPAVDLMVEVDQEAGLLTYQMENRVSASVPSFTSEPRRMVFFLDDAGELYLRRGEEIFNPDAASKFLLTHFTIEYTGC
jgi:hypothetical protein